MRLFPTLMSRLISTTVMLSIMAMGTLSLSAQSVDRLISYQGLLTQATGEPLADGSYRLVLRLYDSPTVGTLVFAETQEVIITKGLFTVLIGQVETTAIAAVDFNRPLWLETAIEGEAPFTPRTRLAVVPNAVVAERARVANQLSPSYNDLVRSINGGQGAMVIKGSNGIVVNRVQDTIRISGTTQNGYAAIETLTSNDGSISVTNPNGPDAIVRVADGGITASKLASGSVTTVKLADGAVTGAKIADGVVTSAKIAAGVIPASLPPSGTAGGDLIGTYPSPLIRAGSVTTDKLANSGVVEGKLADGAVTTAKIVAGGVSTSRIADGAVTSAKLQPTGVVPGTYGDYNKVVQMTVDTAGRVVTARNVTLTGIQPGGPAAGDLTGIYPFPEINRNVAGTNIIASINDNMNPLLWVDGAKVEPLADIAASDIAASGRVDSANLQIKQGAVGANELADVPGLQWWKLYGSSQFIPRIRVDADGRVVEIDSAINGLTPVGPAGGDLSGTYPNPAIANTATAGEHIITAVNHPGVVSSIAATRIVDPEAVAASDVSTSGNLRNMNMQLKSGVVGAAELADIAGLPTSPQGSGTLIPVITVDGDGRVQNLSTTAITGAPPVGAAGGDLAGTYPNPTIRATAGTNIVTAINNGATAGTINPVHIADPAASGVSDITTSGNLGAMNMQVNVGVIGAPELANLHASAIGPVGAATTVPVVSIDTDGRVTALTSTTITGVTPGGAAGGDLAGSYPNPTINATAGNNVVAAINNGATTGRINAPHVIDPAASGLSDITTSGNLGAMNMQVNVGVIGAPELANLHASAIGPVGAATTVPVVSIDTDGRVTALTSTTITGVTPGGAAGGDLAGSYPNPTLATSAAAGARMVDALRADYLAGDVDINTPRNVVMLDAAGNLPTVYEQAFFDGNGSTPYVSFLLPPTTTTSTRLWTLPDVTGTVVVAPSAGTSGRITRFNANSSIVDGSLDDNGTGTLSRAGNVAINVGTGHVLSTNGALSAAEGLSVTGTTTLNTTGAAETRIGNLAGGHVHIDAASVVMANIPASAPTDNIVTINGSGFLRQESVSSLFGSTTWLLGGNALTGTSSTIALGLAAQPANEDALALYTDGVQRLRFRGNTDTADVLVSMVPTANNTHALGSDAFRWSNVYVNGTSLHIGPSGGASANTELRMGYVSGTATMNVDGGATPELSISAGTITMDAQTAVNDVLSMNAAQNIKVLIGAAPFFPGIQDHLIVITAHSAVDVTLPAAPAQGRIYTIRNAAGGVAKIDAGGTDTIEGQVQVNLANGATARFVYDGAGTWYNVGN